MCYQDIFYCILDLPDSRLHLVLQQDRQVCGRFGIFSVAHLKFQTHHNEDKRQNPCCDKRNLISLVTLILIYVGKIALRYVITLRENKQYPSLKGA